MRGIPFEGKTPLMPTAGYQELKERRRERTVRHRGSSLGGGQPTDGLLNGAKRLGGIYRLDYDKAIVITDDFVKREAGGVPRNGFLLAAATVPTRETDAPLDEDEIILLRVRETAALPHENELVATRLAAMRDADVRNKRPEDVVDNLTSSQIQLSAFECDVLGTFYSDTVARQPFIQWGADIDNVYSGARYFVYLPSADVLSFFIASYPERTEQEIQDGVTPDLIDLGVVRFASTRRRASDAKMHMVPVKVRVTDFISRKTAVAGMTRAGKSNTNKNDLHRGVCPRRTYRQEDRPAGLRSPRGVCER